MTTLITGKNNIALARLITLKHGLKIELSGMKIRSGLSIYKIIKTEFNLKGSKQKVYDQFCVILDDLKNDHFSQSTPEKSYKSAVNFLKSKSKKG